MLRQKVCTFFTIAKIPFVLDINTGSFASNGNICGSKWGTDASLGGTCDN